MASGACALEPDDAWPPAQRDIELFEDLGDLSFPIDASPKAQERLACQFFHVFSICSVPRMPTM